MGQSQIPLLRHLMLLCLLVLPLFGHAGDEPEVNSEVASELKHFKELSKQQLSNTRELLQRDIQAQGQRIDVQDKRFDDHGKRLDGQDKRLEAQDQRLSAMDSHTDLWIAGFGLLATLLGVVIPLTAFFSVKNKASEEARKVATEEAKLWLDKQSTELNKKLKTLEDKSQDADLEVETLREKLRLIEDEVLAHANNIKDGLTQHSDTQKQELKEAKEAILEGMTSFGAASIIATEEQQKVVLTAGRSALDKPESMYDWEDWDNRAFAALAEQDLNEAIRCWEKIIQMKSAPAGEQARAMYNKGASLSELKKPADALVTYNEIIRRFSNEDSLSTRINVALAMLNKGVTLGEQNQAEAELATYDELINLFSKETTKIIRTQVAMAMFNKGITLSKQDNLEKAMITYEELVQRFEKDTNKNICQIVSKAQNSNGFTLLCRAKKHWNDKAVRSANLQQAQQLFASALTGHDDESQNIALGNQSYCAHLLGEPPEIVRSILKQALALGEENLYKATLGDLATHPVPEKDEPFRALLEEVWSEVQAEKSQ